MGSKSPMSLRQILHFLEDPKFPSLSPHLRLLKFTGLWHPNRSSNTKFKRVLFYTTFFFFLSAYIKCLISFDVNSVKLILQYVPFHMGIVKSCFFQKDHQLWENLMYYISSVETKQLSRNDQTLSGIINNYITRNRRVTYFFWALAFFSNFSIFSEPYQKNQINANGTSVYLYIFDGFTPFDKEPPGYYASMMIQTVLGHIVSAYVVGWDTLVVSIMIFFAGQLKVARFYCQHISNVENTRQSHFNIAGFHSYYIDLLMYQKQFNELISSVMFVYLAVISVNLGVCIVQIVELQDDLAALVSSVVFMVACLIQLLIFYWHANEVTIESQQVSYAMFKSDWLLCDRSVQKDVALLSLTTTKTLMFTAGPFNKISLATFVAILRSSCSFYTLINGTNSQLQ